MPLGWKMDKDFKDIPLSESNVSLKLADIQRRCSELLSDPDQMVELSLEESPVEPETERAKIAPTTWKPIENGCGDPTAWSN